MPVTARLSKQFYERLGDEATNELVNWLNDWTLSSDHSSGRLTTAIGIASATSSSRPRRNSEPKSRLNQPPCVRRCTR